MSLEPTTQVEILLSEISTKLSEVIEESRRLYTLLDMRVGD
ncbi:MAG: hypothetical protein ACFE9D_01230 [Promethearchaeota archaeon]